MSPDQFSYQPYEDLPVKVRLQTLWNAVEFLEVRYPHGEVAMKLRDQKLELIRQLEAQLA